MSTSLAREVVSERMAIAPDSPSSFVDCPMGAAGGNVPTAVPIARGLSHSAHQNEPAKMLICPRRPGGGTSGAMQLHQLRQRNPPALIETHFLVLDFSLGVSVLDDRMEPGASLHQGRESQVAHEAEPQLRDRIWPEIFTQHAGPNHTGRPFNQQVAAPVFRHQLALRGLHHVGEQATWPQIDAALGNPPRSWAKPLFQGVRVCPAIKQLGRRQRDIDDEFEVEEWMYGVGHALNYQQGSKAVNALQSVKPGSFKSAHLGQQSGP